MEATHIKAVTYYGTGEAVLVITPGREDLRGENWDARYTKEAEEIAQFLRQTFCRSTLYKLKEIL